jgi:hypothetical protein
MRHDNEHDHALVYVNIPKNASTWMKHVFKPAQDSNFHEIKYRKIHYLVILRDPIDRWISGFAQAQVGTTPFHSSHYTHMGWDQVFKKIIFDNHTEPQVSFLHGLDTKNITWFWFGPNLYQDIQHWATVSGWNMRDRRLQDSEMNEFNQSCENPAQKFCDPRDINTVVEGPSAWQIMQEARQALTSNRFWQQQLEYVYRHDLDLINSVVFYRKELQ